jgi:hypothetical protein
MCVCMRVHKCPFWHMLCLLEVHGATCRVLLNQGKSLARVRGSDKHELELSSTCTHCTTLGLSLYIYTIRKYSASHRVAVSLNDQLLAKVLNTDP